MKVWSARMAARRYGLFCLFAPLIVITGVVLGQEEELRLAVPLVVGLTAVMTIACAGVLYCGERFQADWSAWSLLSVALLVRLAFVFSPPQLSDDIYRYLWDGSNMLRGINPYSHSPAAMPSPPKLADVHSRINHAEYITIYPPAAQLIFAGGALFGGSITGLKACLVCFDIVLCAVLIRVLRCLEMPAWRAVLYAWNPLPVVEIAGSGHVDGAGMTLVLGAVLLALAGDRSEENRRGCFYGGSGVLIACAGMVKLFPFVFVPLLFLLVPQGQRKNYAIGFFAAVAVLTGLFLPDLRNITASLNAYARNWEFAGCAFTVLRSMTGSGDSARLILIAAFLASCAVVYLQTCVAIKHTATPSAQAHTVLRACYAVAMAFLLLTPTLQPWYALCLAVFLPFCAGPAGLVLCWVVFLTYQVQIPYFILGQWLESPAVTAAVFLAPLTAFLLSRVYRIFQSSAAVQNQ